MAIYIQEDIPQLFNYTVEHVQKLNAQLEEREGKLSEIAQNAELMVYQVGIEK